MSLPALTQAEIIFVNPSAPQEPNARQFPAVWPDQGCGPPGYPLRRRSHDQASRRTLFMRALGQCSRGDGLMYENAALAWVCRSLVSFALVFPVESIVGKRGLRI